jgi:hypothetical protein
MKKKHRASLEGSANRRNLIKIARHLGIDRPTFLKNGMLINAICEARGIKLDASKRAIGQVIEWFRLNEPEVSMKKRKADPKPALPATYSEKQSFYQSWDWRKLRMQALKMHGPRCQCCGAGNKDRTTSGDPVKICVDHIQPLALRWDLRLDINNLQINLESLRVQPRAADAETALAIFVACISRVCDPECFGRSQGGLVTRCFPCVSKALKHFFLHHGTKPQNIIHFALTEKYAFGIRRIWQNDSLIPSPSKPSARPTA